MVTVCDLAKYGQKSTEGNTIVAQYICKYWPNYSVV